MKNLINKFVVKRHHLIVEEEDVIRVLSVIQKHHKILPDMAVGNCGWDDEKKWFIHFETTEYKWKAIRTDLKVIRVFENLEIPKKCIGKVYTTD